MQRAARRLRPDLDNHDTASLERACAFIRQPPKSKHSVWYGGLNLHLRAGKLWITREVDLTTKELGLLPQLAGNKPLQVNLPGRTVVAENCFLEAEFLNEIQSARSFAEQNTDPFKAWIDLESVQANMSIRKRQVGDFILPLGMDGHTIKVSDLMINLKVPRQARNNWPIVTSGDQIVWIPGLRLAEPFKLKLDSKLAVFLRMVTI
jgi:tRNA(Ile)-lysidine synthase